jgi:hypothetical protein
VHQSKFSLSLGDIEGIGSSSTRHNMKGNIEEESNTSVGRKNNSSRRKDKEQRERDKEMNK